MRRIRVGQRRAEYQRGAKKRAFHAHLRKVFVEHAGQPHGSFFCLGVIESGAELPERPRPMTIAWCDANNLAYLFSEERRWLKIDIASDKDYTAEILKR